MGLFDGARERIAIFIETRGGREATKTFDDIGTSAGRAGQQVEGRFTRVVNAGLQKVGIQSKVTGSALQTGLVAAAGAAAAGVATAIEASVDAFTSGAFKVRDFARASGASAEESSRFVAVLDDLEISADAGAQSVFRLARNAESNAKKFAELGVEIARNADGTLDLVGTVENAADAYAGTADQGKRAELALGLFGKQGRDLIPVLEKGGDAVREMFAGVKDPEIFSTEAIAKAEDYRLAVDSLSDAVTGFGRIIGEDVVTQFADVINGLALVVEKGTAVTDALGGAGKAAEAFTAGVPGLNLVVGVLGHFGSEATDAAKAQRELEQETQAAADAADREAAAVKEATEAVHDSVDAALDRADANDKLTDALDKLAEAEALDPGKERAEADRDQAAAVRSQEDAVERLADAQERLNEIKNQDIALERHRADLADRRAKQNAKEAEHTRDQAKAELDRLQGDTASTPEQIAKAQEELEDATLGVDEANQAAKDSAQAVKDLQDPTKTKEYRDAVRAVADAEDGVARANEAVAESQRKIDALKPEDKARAIERAQRDVERAIEDVATAAGDGADDQIAAYQRLITVVPPQMRKFIQDRIYELQALRYEATLTANALASMLGVVSGETPAPPRPPEALPTTPPPNPAAPADKGNIGALFPDVPTAPSTGGSDTGGSRPADDRLLSYTDARTFINIDKMMPHDYSEFRRETDAERRLNALAS